MLILLAPSENKSTQNSNHKFNIHNLLIPQITQNRQFIIDKYQKCCQDDIFLKKAVKGLNIKTKFEDELSNIALLRYNGVAFKAIDFQNLKEDEQDFLKNSVIIFSNIFGVIRGGDYIPFYHMKQGEILQDFNQYQYYANVLSKPLDDFLKNELVIDLRAGFYEKIYTIKNDFITFKFSKNGKIQSHFAKHYRGQITKYIAQQRPKNLNEILNMNMQDLKIYEILTINNKTEIHLNILG